MLLLSLVPGERRRTKSTSPVLLPLMTVATPAASCVPDAGGRHSAVTAPVWSDIAHTSGFAKVRSSLVARSARWYSTARGIVCSSLSLFVHVRSTSAVDGRSNCSAERESGRIFISPSPFKPRSPQPPPPPPPPRHPLVRPR